MRLIICSLTVAAICLSPTAIRAQEIEQRADSLEREVKLLRERLDSLELILSRLVSEGKDTVEVIDELAALRAAARAVAPEEPADTAPSRFVMRSRNLAGYNPEISVTGDVRVSGNRPGPQENNVDLREFSVGFQSALDPYSNTKIFFAFGEEGVEIEEAYAYWTGLPGGTRLDVGRFRQQLGELNRWHLHAMPETEYPLVLREYFGEGGLAGNGLGLFWVAPVTTVGGAVHEFWAQTTLGDNEVLFENGNRLSVLGHVNNFWQVNRSTFLQVGATGVYGQNPDVGLETSVLGADFRLSWRPPHQAIFRSFMLRGEGYAVKKRTAGVGESRYGGFISTTYQASRRVHFGARIDYLQPLVGTGERIWAFVPQFTFWQSAWVFLKAEWQHQSEPRLAGRVTSDRLVLQVVWSIGPHKHENY